MAKTDQMSELKELKKRNLRYALIFLIIFFLIDIVLFYFDMSLLNLIKRLVVSAFAVIAVYYTIRSAKIKDGKIADFRPYSFRTLMGMIALVIAAVFYAFLAIYLVLGSPPTGYFAMLGFLMAGAAFTVIGFLLLKKKKPG